MNILINLTQHTLTKEQFSFKGENLVEITFKPYNGVSKGSTDYVKHLLNFTSLPTKDEIIKRAAALADYASGLLDQAKNDGDKLFALVGGAPYLMGALETALKERGIQPLYAYSQRESVETINADGSVTKTAIFKHIGYIEA
jgi:hypothetical protein